MGEVWRATDTVLDRPVAVKLLKQEHADDSLFRSRFETEAHNAAGLHHTGVAQVFDFGSRDPDHPPYLVMEYVDARPLPPLPRPGEPMDPAAAAALIAAVGDALGAAHARSIVHRDVKPANVLVTDDHQVRITDFGIARAADAVTLTRSGEVLGTPQYISPEQAEGLPATPASDVYALAVVAFECLAGHRPFQAESPVATALAHLRAPVPDLPERVPVALAAVVRRGMAKDPAERHPDGAVFAAAVREAIASPTAVLPAPTVTSAAMSEGRRVPLPVWVAAVALVAVLAIAAFAATTGGGGGPSPADQRTGSTATTPPVTPNTNPQDNSGPGNGGDDGGDDNSGPGNGNGHGRGNGNGNGNGHRNGHRNGNGHGSGSGRGPDHGPSKHGEGDQ